MKPVEAMKSEQKLQMFMLGLNAVYDETFTDGEAPHEDKVINVIIVLSDSATFLNVDHYKPQNQDYETDSNFNTLPQGEHFGFFKHIVVNEGTVRLMAL